MYCTILLCTVLKDKVYFIYDCNVLFFNLLCESTETFHPKHNQSSLAERPIAVSRFTFLNFGLLLILLCSIGMKNSMAPDRKIMTPAK